MSEQVRVERKEDVIDTLLDLIKNSDKTYDIVRIRDAIDMAVNAHDGQLRQSGEEYVCHPLHVACILVEIGMDSDAVAAALLHDVVEDTDIELSEIARRSAMSKSCFCKLFSSITGTSFKHYLNSCRVNHAAELLKAGEKVSTVSTLCGYDDFSTFYRNFIKIMDISPAQYQKLHLKRL